MLFLWTMDYFASMFKNLEQYLEIPYNDLIILLLIICYPYRGEAPEVMKRLTEGGIQLTQVDAVDLFLDALEVSII
jgi:hypothetical protein